LSSLSSHGNLYLFVESKGFAVFRPAIFALLIVAPAAFGQETEEEGRRLAAAFTQTDFDTLGACQARVEGMGRLVDEFQDWMLQQGFSKELAGIRSARAKGADLIDRLQDLRTALGATDGFSLSSSEDARSAIAATFTRRAGESEFDAYNRWHGETKLPPSCSEAMKRARWKAEIDALGEDE
jgi:hypothetical protein